METRILELLTTHGTLVTPDIINYILSKDDPESYVQTIMRRFTEVPLFLSVELLKRAEEAVVAAEAVEAVVAVVAEEAEEAVDAVDAVEVVVAAEAAEAAEVAEVVEVAEAEDVTVTDSKGQKAVEGSNKTVEFDEPIEFENNIVPKESTKSELSKLSDLSDKTKVPNVSEVSHAYTKPVTFKQNSSISTTRNIPAKDHEAKISIIRDVSGQSTSEGTLDDFKKYFQERFKKLRRILQNQRREVMGAGEISRIRNHKGPMKVIGIVNSVRTTKNGHKLIELEDESDSISALINSTNPLIDMSIVNDEVICVIGKIEKGDLIYVEDIVRPDIPFARKKNRLEVPLGCMFISDIHIGSTTFLHDAWDRFTQWLNGKYSLNGFDGVRDRLKYIVVSGDIVDGIGIYPSQEDELEISDIYAQYEALANKFTDIPEHIKLIVQPGNHDAVRLAEPQPTFPTEIKELFTNDILFVGNPCYFAIDNLEILSYHGRSMDDFVLQIPSVSYNKPIQIMKEMLTRRHLAPVYGDKTPIAPEHQDYLTIDRIPDIFVTGHIHKTAFEYYRDILLINASAWQSQTTYQKMMNFNPDPAQAIYTDLHTGKAENLKFI